VVRLPGGEDRARRMAEHLARVMQLAIDRVFGGR
jgi:hypothetical protein